ncbi:MAG: hypothetical protein BroJett040_25690 [Oligoflexia bacterium]|nr:MAG: hypothetical protein BroJett040_25690 [Oligoflexia bacterium]
MKSIILGLLFCLSLNSAYANENLCPSSRQAIHGGGGDLTPWPWGSEIRLPWARVHGLWQSMSGDCRTWFLFKVGKPNSNGERIIKVIQYDPISCQVISSGVGYENKRVIYASMVGINGSFDLTVRAFAESDVIPSSRYAQEDPGSGKTTDPVVVIHMYPKGRWDNRVDYEVRKLQSTTEMLCRK